MAKKLAMLAKRNATISSLELTNLGKTMRKRPTEFYKGYTHYPNATGCGLGIYKYFTNTGNEIYDMQVGWQNIFSCPDDVQVAWDYYQETGHVLDECNEIEGCRLLKGHIEPHIMFNGLWYFEEKKK